MLQQKIAFITRFQVHLALLLAFACSITACRKDQLQPQGLQQIETYTTTDRLNKILFINDSIGFIVGGNRFFNAAILKTEDGGTTWQYYHDETDNGIYGITRSSSGRIYTIGWMGEMNITSDEGVSWQKKQTRYEEYKDLAFANESRGVAVGGISFITGYLMYLDSEGNVLRHDSLSHELNDIEQVDGKTAYICGYGVLYKTSDSMKTWQQLDVKNDNFTAVHAYANGEVWTCGYNGSIFHSPDGGQRWERKRNGNDVTRPRYRLLDIGFADPLHGYAVGEKGLMICTNDGGTHWMEYKSFTKADLRNIYIRKDGAVFVCGDNGALFKLPATQ